MTSNGADAMNNVVMQCKALTKQYHVGPEPVVVLDALEFTLNKGEWVSVVGASGSGKTTLLNMLAGLDQPSSGQVFWGEQDIRALDERALGELRNRHVGFVYQFHHLLAEFTAVENVAMPLWIQGVNKKAAMDKARVLLGKVGLSHRMNHKPAELSGGERQRVGIARALITEPALVLLDEPTGNLDSHTGAEIQSLLTELNEVVDTAFVVVTHDLQFAALAQKQYRLSDGVLNQM